MLPHIHILKMLVVPWILDMVVLPQLWSNLCSINTSGMPHTHFVTFSLHCIRLSIYYHFFPLLLFPFFSRPPPYQKHNECYKLSLSPYMYIYSLLISVYRQIFWHTLWHWPLLRFSSIISAILSSLLTTIHFEPCHVSEQWAYIYTHPYSPTGWSDNNNVAQNVLIIWWYLWIVNVKWITRPGSMVILCTIYIHIPEIVYLWCTAILPLPSCYRTMYHKIWQWFSLDPQ